MDIYLTDLETGDRLRFPMLPESINVQTGAIFQNYTVLAVGDIRLPTGDELTGFTWDGKLPGKLRENEPYVREWRNPHEIQSLWSVYRNRKKKLRLLVTETPINHDVYIQRYNVTYSGGHGDYDYNISFTQAKDLRVLALTPATAQEPATAPAAATRPEPPPATTYTVKPGDSLWKIAQQLMGGGANYPALYEANKAVIGPNPSLIHPGQVLTIPS